MPIFSHQAIGNRQQATGVSELQGSRVSEAGHDNNGDVSDTSAHQHISTSTNQHGRPTTLRVTGRDAFATPSITGALRDKQTVNDQSENNPVVSLPRINSFTQEKLTEVWKVFVETFEAPQLKSALSSREPKLLDQWHIEYVLDTELQLQRLTLDLKPKLLGHLRRELSNESIEIDFLISTHHNEKPSVPYTESEKWQSLVEKYPALAALKTKFGLDFEQY